MKGLGRRRHSGVNPSTSRHVDEAATKQARERHKLGQQVLDFWFVGILGRNAKQIIEANRMERWRNYPQSKRARNRAHNKAARISRRRNRTRR